MIDNLLELNNFCDYEFNKIKEKKLAIVLNTQNNDGQQILKYEKANLIECFTDKEYTEIVNAFLELDIDFEVFFNELEFIEAIINKRIFKDNLIVFNFARNGIKEGKKSLIPSFCDLLKISYTGSNAFVQSLCRNKYIYSILLHQLGISVPKTYAVAPNLEWLDNRIPDNLTNVIIKPISESGSIGISNKIIDFKHLNINELKFIHNQPMLIQEFIFGEEVECPFYVLNRKVIHLPAVKLLLNDKQFLTTQNSANNNYKFELYNNYCTSLQSIVENVVSVLNITGYGRIDFRITETGEAYLFDIATMPFLCEHSSFTFAMKSLGLRNADIFKIILCISNCEQ